MRIAATAYGIPALPLPLTGPGLTPARVLVHAMLLFLAIGCIELRGKEYCPDLYHILPYQQLAVLLCGLGGSVGGKCQKYRDCDLLVLYRAHLGMSWGGRLGRPHRVTVNLDTLVVQVNAQP